MADSRKNETPSSLKGTDAKKIAGIASGSAWMVAAAAWFSNSYRVANSSSYWQELDPNMPVQNLVMNNRVGIALAMAGGGALIARYGVSQLCEGIDALVDITGRDVKSGTASAVASAKRIGAKANEFITGDLEVNPVACWVNGGPRPTPRPGSTKRSHTEMLAVIDAAKAMTEGANASEGVDVLKRHLRNEQWTQDVAARYGLSIELDEPPQPAELRTEVGQMGAIMQRAKEENLNLGAIADTARAISDMYRGSDRDKVEL